MNMKTPCEQKGYKVGDSFVVLSDTDGFVEGQVIRLFKDDGSSAPLFSGDNEFFTYCDGNPGAFVRLHNVRKLGEDDQWVYVSGTANDFKGAPDWATVLVGGDTLYRKYFAEKWKRNARFVPVGGGSVDRIHGVYTSGQVIAERKKKEVKQITLMDILVSLPISAFERLGILSADGKYIAQDSDGRIWVYRKKPVAGEGIYTWSGGGVFGSDPIHKCEVVSDYKTSVLCLVDVMEQRRQSNCGKYEQVIECSKAEQDIKKLVGFVDAVDSLHDHIEFRGDLLDSLQEAKQIINKYR